MSAKIGTDIKRRVSHAKKVANDYQRQKDIMDIYDLWYGDFRNYEDIDNYDINYDLYNGRLDVSLYEDPVCINIDGEKVKFGFQEITHYPLISQIANAMYGEIISRPFLPVAKHYGTTAQTMRRKKWNELIREMISQEILMPLQDSVTQQYFQQYGINDPYGLSIEQMQQVEADIKNRVNAKTADEILEFMQNDFQTPTQRQAQQLLDYFVAYQDIKYKQQEGFKHAIITAREVYYIGDRHGEPVMELCNPKYFTWGGSQNTEWYQDGTWAKYEQWLTIEEVTQKYAEHFSSRNLRELEGFAEPIGGFRATGEDPRRDKVLERTMYELSLEDGYFARKYGNLNYKTKEDHQRFIGLYGDVIKKYGAVYGNAFSNYGIREAHITWRDKTKLKKVTRVINGELKDFWRDEFYETRQEDVKVVDVWVDQIWEGTKLGGGNSISDFYVNIRPIPGQYKSIFNPFGVSLPYVGKSYNTHMNNSRNVSIIDLGKPWQMEFDTTMATIKHNMATDIGKVFMMSLGMKPQEWKWQDWFNTMREGRILMTDFQKHGLPSFNPDLLRSVDLSRSQEIAQQIGYLEFFKNNLVQAMNFNSARIGAIGQYATNQSIQQQQSASYNQTEGYFETHRQIVEKALNAFMNRAKFLYKDNRKTHFILDDVARTELEISPDFWYEEWAIEFSTSSDEVRKLEQLRQQMLAFAQNGMSFDGILALALADTPSDVIEIMKKESMRIRQEQQQQLQAQQEMKQAELESEAREKQLDREAEIMKQREQLESQERRALIDSEKFRKQQDVDANNIADSLQKAFIELKVKQELEALKLAQQNKEHEDEIRLEERKLDIEEMKVKEERRDRNR